MDHAELSVAREAGRALKAGCPYVPRDLLASRTRGLSTGTVVDLLDGRTFVGRGLYDEGSPLAVSVFTRDRKQGLDAAFWRAGIERAAELRRSLVNLTWTDAWRAVNSEGDGLPGLVVETYSSYAVLRLQSEALRPHLGAIVDGVRMALQPRGLYEKRRTAEGARGHHLGGSTAPDALPVREGNLRFLARMAEGEQTGFYLDLREARRAVARYARGKQVVNACSFTSTLSLTAAVAGSPRVVSVDGSPRSTAWGRENFAANGLPPESHEFMTGRPAEVLGRIAASTRRFDLALVEVPSFPEPVKPEPSRKPAKPTAKKGTKKGAKKATKKKTAKKAGKPSRKPAKKPARKAAKGKRRRMAPPPPLDPVERFRRGYGELVRAAVSVLQPHGLLGCAIHEQDLAFNDFLSLLRESAEEVGATLQVLEVHGLPPDFPVNPAWPRGRYLRFVFCAIRR